MENVAATKLKSLKPISKTKLKKTIKNVVCRPDPVNWLLVSDNEKHRIEITLQDHSIVIPEFKKPHWRDVKSLPKELRPKPPPCKKVDGLLFGLSECQESILKGICSGILIESEINPKCVAEPIIEDCLSNSIPYLSFKDLRKLSAKNFGIPTSCLGIKKDKLLDIQKVLKEIHNQKCQSTKDIETSRSSEKVLHQNTEKADTNKDIQYYPYLYRNNKNTRVFIPSESATPNKLSNKFSGQNVIEISDNNRNVDRKTYMNMILKRISSNPNRVKLKK